MDRRLKERLIGATLVAVAIVLIVPELLSGPKHPPSIPAATAEGAADRVRNVTVDLATNKATPVDEPAASAPSAALPEAAAPVPATADDATTPAAPPGAEAGHAAAPPVISTLKAQQAAPPVVENNSPTPTSLQGQSHDGVAQDAPARGWSVQLGSFASRANAEREMRRLKTHGTQAYLAPVGKGSSARYRVRVGPFADRAAAEQEVRKLGKDGRSAKLMPP